MPTPHPDSDETEGPGDQDALPQRPVTDAADVPPDEGDGGPTT